MAGAQNGAAPLDAIATLTSVIGDLASVIKELKTEVAEQNQQLKDLRDHKAARKKLPNAGELSQARRLPLDGRPSTIVRPNTSREAHRDQNINCHEFHLFSRLPIELRMRVWKLALPGDRMFEPYVESSHRSLGGRGMSQANMVFSIAGTVINLHNQNPAHHQHFHGQQQPQQPQQQPQLTTQTLVSADPPFIRFANTYPPPTIRSVCREARRAAQEAGRFEFGVMSGERRGQWFNHSSDVICLYPDFMQYLNFGAMDLVRVQNIGFSHHQFKTEQGCKAALDFVLAQMPACKKVALFFDLEARSSMLTRHSSMSAATYQALQDDDLLGHHGFPDSLNVNDPLKWVELERVVNQIWVDHLASKGFGPDKAPVFVGLDVIRRSRGWY